MNVHKALSRDNSAPLTTRWRSHKRRERKGSAASQERTWFTSEAAAPDYDLREAVAERFMSMSAAHDRIRTKLLATGR